MLHDAKCSLIVGKRGAGKSTLLKTLLKSQTRLIVVTPISRDFDRGFIKVSTPNQLRDTLKKVWNTPFKIRVCRDYDISDTTGPIRDLHEICELLKTGQNSYAKDKSKKRVHLVCDETSLYFPHHRPAGLHGFRWAVLQGRNWGIDLTAATQRPTQVPPEFRDNVDDLYYLALGGDAAIKKAVETVGGSYREMLRTIPKYQYLRFRDGELIEGNSTKTAPKT